MARLLRQTQNQSDCIANQIKTADSLFSRMKGLLGTHDLPENEALWIRPCNSVHTMFMNYAIDLIFVTSELKVCGLQKQLPPWRMTLPIFKARSVFEMRAGSISHSQLKIGDQLYVDP